MIIRSSGFETVGESFEKRQKSWKIDNSNNAGYGENLTKVWRWIIIELKEDAELKDEISTLFHLSILHLLSSKEVKLKEEVKMYI